MFSQEIFSTRLRELRIAKGLSQEALGEILGTTKNYVSDMERCRRTTTFEKLVAIADCFDVSADYLLGRTDEPGRT